MEERRRLTYPQYSPTISEDDRSTVSTTGDDSSTDSTVDTTESDCTMVETHNLTEVEDLLRKQPHGELAAILTPTKMDIIKFTEALATALTSCNSKKAITGGQAYLVLNKAEFKLRVKNQTVRYPQRPQKPVDYDDANFDSKS